MQFEDGLNGRTLFNLTYLSVLYDNEQEEIFSSFFFLLILFYLFFNIILFIFFIYIFGTVEHLAHCLYYRQLEYLRRSGT